MSIADLIKSILNIKGQIREAIANKGIEINTSTPFSKYPELINNISASTGENEQTEEYEKIIKQLTGTVDLSDTINLPETVTKLRSYTFPSTKTEYHVNAPNVTEIEYYTFTQGISPAYNVGIKTFNAPNLSIIRDSAFEYCANLDTLVIGNLTYIGASACGYLRKPNICITANQVKDLEFIGQYAFQTQTTQTQNAGLNIQGDICFNKNITIQKYGMARFHNNYFHTVAFSNNAALNEYAFQNNNALTQIDLTTVEVLPRYLLENCKNLTKVTLDSSITALPNGFAAGCDKLAEINLDNITKLGSSALTYANIPHIEFNNKVEIDAYTFQYSKITWLGFPKGMSYTGTSTGIRTFGNMKNLQKIFISKESEFKRAQGLFTDSSTNLMVYTDFEDEEAIPPQWKTDNWLKIDSSHNAQITYNTSYDTFLQLVSEDANCI